MTRTALVRCTSYDAAAVEPAVERAFTLLGGLSQFVRRGDSVLVKPNLLTGQPPENAATTHPQVLDALLSQLLDLGARPRIGDSPAFGWVADVAEKCGVAAVARKYDVPLVEFTNPTALPSVRPSVLRQFVTDRAIRDADVVINVPKLKSHRQLGFTGAVKNLYGCMPGKRKAYYHFARGNRDAHFAHLVASFAYSVAPALTLADAVVAMERDGPSGGDPRPVGALVAGTDPAAVDATLAALIRAPHRDHLLLDACRELKLGCPDLEALTVMGDPVSELALHDFVHPLLIGVRFSPGRLVRSVWRNFLITRLGHTPR